MLLSKRSKKGEFAARVTKKFLLFLLMRNRRIPRVVIGFVYANARVIVARNSRGHFPTSSFGFKI